MAEARRGGSGHVPVRLPCPPAEPQPPRAEGSLVHGEPVSVQRPGAQGEVWQRQTRPWVTTKAPRSGDARTTNHPGAKAPSPAKGPHPHHAALQALQWRQSCGRPPRPAQNNAEKISIPHTLAMLFPGSPTFACK